MLPLTSCECVTSALNDRDLDVELRALLGRRAWQLLVYQADWAGDDIPFFVIEGGDTPELINTTVGFPITGEHAEEPSYDWIEDHERWFEIAYGGPRGPLRVFVENDLGTELGIHCLCLSHFWPTDEERQG
jgi:hypothetical protein